jgi:hypothetical protein
MQSSQSPLPQGLWAVEAADDGQLVGGATLLPFGPGDLQLVMRWQLSQVKISAKRVLISSSPRPAGACERAPGSHDIAVGCVNTAHEGMEGVARWAALARRCCLKSSQWT